jgi:putative colanic acid biosynthesis acetyltransferase WcaF
MDLSRYDNSHYHPGAGAIRRMAWYVCNALIFDTWWVPSSRLKRILLRSFGATIGAGVVIKPKVNIKYPWNLQIGNGTWIGERVWLDNLVDITIGANACISQGAYLFTGNHDYKADAFTLVTRAVTIQDSAWVGAFATVCPGVTIRQGSVLSVRSVAFSDTEAGWIYKGSPAVKVRPRHAALVQLTG